MQQSKNRILELNPTTKVYETSDAYRKEYIRCKKTNFIPNDEKEYRSIKIMFHKLLPKYRWNSRALLHISKAYNGAGFTLVNRNYMFENNKKYRLNVYDINSAYQHTLFTDDYILSPKYKVYTYIFNTIKLHDFIKKFKNSKYIVNIEFRGLTPKYNYVDYNIYEQQLNIKIYKDKVTYIGWLCDIDLMCLLKLYNYTECKIYYVYKFLEIGKLKVKNFILAKYEKLHNIQDKAERKNYKTMLHIATYGKNAERSKWNWDKRSKYAILAIYQSAYIRKRLVNIFLKYKNNVAYIDTDCVFLKSNIKPTFKVGKDIGDFKLEYKNIKAYINRIKAYILYENNKRILYKWSGLNTELTEKQIKDIENGKVVVVKEQRAGKVQKFKIYNKYIIGNWIDL